MGRQRNRVSVQKVMVCFVATLFLPTTIAYGQTTPREHSGTASKQQEPYQPITGHERLRWVVKSTIGARTLSAGLFTAGFGTGLDRPKEYGPHWDGFGKRYGMRLTGVATGNAMEAGLGSLWGEDPRYFRATGEPVKGRIKNVIVMTFMARRGDATLAPAYARYAGNVGNNFLSNTWRADSEATASNACLRILLGFAGRMGANAFEEFWPDARRYVFRKRH
jgi:hypothetical protein